MRIHPWIVAAVLITAAPRPAKGDGGVIRLRQTQGPFSVTVFSPAEVIEWQATDVSMLIQEAATGKVVLDATVSFSPRPPEGVTGQPSPESCCRPRVVPTLANGKSKPVRVPATREHASNKLLYAAPLEFGAPGNWKLQILVSRETDLARFDCQLPVAVRPEKLTTLWPFLSFPPLAVTAFLLNQWLRRQSLRKRPMVAPVA